jgi:two-component system response regulator AtoC
MEKSGKVLIVDDDSLILETLNELFIDDFEVVQAVSGAMAIDFVKNDGDLDAVVLDIKMAKMDGLETAGQIKSVNSDLPIIFFTGYPGDYSEGQIDRKYHPFDYVIKNERPERLQRAVKNAVTFSRLRKESADLALLAREEYGMVGKSPQMQEVYQIIEKIAPTDAKVMLAGPTGSGKELVARAIHRRSLRANRKLGIFHCSRRQPDLVESELFGHLRGAFTGAVEDRIGLFEYANGGTLFLDEVCDLDLTTQAKLLRAIENGEMQRMGSPEVVKVDVRVMCATNRDLERMVQKGQFREDLYYRLKGVTIYLPALKDRREDIPPLIDYIVERYALESGNGIKIFEPAARDLLIEYDWPGNARQLLHTVQALMDLSVSSYITREDVERQLRYSGEFPAGSKSFHEQLREMKRTIVIRALAQSEDNISAAARKLSLDRSNLYKMMKELGIKSPKSDNTP